MRAPSVSPPTRPPTPTEKPRPASVPPVTTPEDEVLMNCPPMAPPARAPTAMPFPPVTLALARLTSRITPPGPTAPNKPTLPLLEKPSGSTDG